MVRCHGLGFFGLLVMVCLGCAGTEYTCTCYCVKTNPIDEQAITVDACVEKNHVPEEDALKYAECPVGYQLSGCEDCMQEFDEEDQPISCETSPFRSGAPKLLKPMPDPKFSR